MSYPIADIDGIGPDDAVALKRVGIRTTDGLLEAAKSSKGRKQLAATEIETVGARLRALSREPVQGAHGVG